MITHPEYDKMVDNWKKFRFTYAGGKPFVGEYLVKRPAETEENYKLRVKMSHCPAHAKSNLNEIKNSIFTRMHQGVSREGGSQVYQAAVKGENGGVDRQHATMTKFIGSSLLPELLSIGKVGVWVDAPVAGGQPYFNIYRAEDILSWEMDPENPGHFSKVFLRRFSYKTDELFGFPSEETHSFRAIIKTEDGIAIVDLDEDQNILAQFTLNLPSIPFVIAELTESLLTDVADYQVTLLNLDSADVMYCWSANQPIYTEQIDRNNEMLALMGVDRNPDDSPDVIVDPITNETRNKKFKRSGATRKVGATEGIGYAMGADRPDFISPPSDPLEVSMKKQEVLRDDIRTLINLSLTTVQPRAASAESKELDERGLEAGLSAIGLELEALENRLAELWADYEETKAAKVNYPDEYELKSDRDRLMISEDLIKLKEKFPSQSIKVALLKQAVSTMLAGKIPNDDLEKMFVEIDEANGCTGDVEAIIKDHEAGLVSAATASKNRGYADGEAAIAQKEKDARIEASRDAQRGDPNFANAQVRGNGTDPEADKDKELVDA